MVSSVLVVLVLAMAVLALVRPASVPLVAQLTNQDRPAARMPTITTLPAFPAIPLYASILSAHQKNVLVQTLIDNKVSTMPAASSRSYRVGKFTSTGIFDGYPPTEEQVSRIAPSYDNILLGAKRSELIPLFKRYNPDLTFFLYIDSGLNPTYKQSDAGGVDSEDTQWILTHHPDWLLQDKDGYPISSGGGLSNVVRTMPLAFWLVAFILYASHWVLHG